MEDPAQAPPRPPSVAAAPPAAPANISSYSSSEEEEDEDVIDLQGLIDQGKEGARAAQQRHAIAPGPSARHLPVSRLQASTRRLEVTSSAASNGMTLNQANMEASSSQEEAEEQFDLSGALSAGSAATRGAQARHGLGGAGVASRGTRHVSATGHAHMSAQGMWSLIVQSPCVQIRHVMALFCSLSCLWQWQCPQ